MRYSLNMIKKAIAEGKQVKVYLIGQKAVPAIKNAQRQLNFEIRKTYVDILDDVNSSSALTSSIKTLSSSWSFSQFSDLTYLEIAAS